MMLDAAKDPASYRIRGITFDRHGDAARASLSVVQ
jgi:hypothetical protein